MNVCPKCQQEIPPDAPSCPACPQPLAVPPPAAEAAFSRLAIFSLALGIVGILTGGLLSVAGIGLGVMAIRRINRAGGALRGKNLAIAGIVCGAITALLGLVLFSLLGVIAVWLKYIENMFGAMSGFH